MMAKPSVYIAGPAVFHPGWPSFAQLVAQKCMELGLKPLFPIAPSQSLDRPGIIGVSKEGTEADARAIFRDCLSQIRKCDAVIADLTPFRGEEPDSGTVVETSFAFSLGKPVIGYVQKPKETKGTPTSYGGRVDAEGFVYECFGFSTNLMVENVCQVVLQGDVGEALAWYAATLEH